MVGVCSWLSACRPAWLVSLAMVIGRSDDSPIYPWLLVFSPPMCLRHRLWIPVAFRLLAFASWTFLLPLRSSAVLAVGLLEIIPNLIEVIMFCSVELRLGWVPFLLRGNGCPLWARLDSHVYAEFPRLCFFPQYHRRNHLLPVTAQAKVIISLLLSDRSHVAPSECASVCS